MNWELQGWCPCSPEIAGSWLGKGTCWGGGQTMGEWWQCHTGHCGGFGESLYANTSTSSLPFTSPVICCRHILCVLLEMWPLGGSKRLGSLIELPLTPQMQLPLLVIPTVAFPESNLRFFLICLRLSRGWTRLGVYRRFIYNL